MLPMFLNDAAMITSALMGFTTATTSSSGRCKTTAETADCIDEGL